MSLVLFSYWVYSVVRTRKAWIIHIYLCSPHHKITRFAILYSVFLTYDSRLLCFLNILLCTHKQKCGRIPTVTAWEKQKTSWYLSFTMWGFSGLQQKSKNNKHHIFLILESSRWERFLLIIHISGRVFVAQNTPKRVRYPNALYGVREVNMAGHLPLAWRRPCLSSLPMPLHGSALCLVEYRRVHSTGSSTKRALC